MEANGKDYRGGDALALNYEELYSSVDDAAGHKCCRKISSVSDDATTYRLPEGEEKLFCMGLNGEE